ncbi:hypothetical protein E1B28_013195 [Marasmius oreades]|uniref:Uncharacterized protein n=1 Tax=Marasmius oreades TaxID=181124 RepID=A0A9P7UMR9_9AGAR|nr:uncharacterized protein E1B28_013195 [Marasmius oreades]KAG7087215.1 hypothetical protein E1B28_013195 [Marasmius oreades]
MRTLLQTTGLPWIDEQHRRYLVTCHEGYIIGILILTPIHGPHQPPASEVSSAPAPAPVPTTSPLKQKHKFFLPHKSSPETSPETSSERRSSQSTSELSPIQSPIFPSHSLSSSSSSLNPNFSLHMLSKSAPSSLITLGTPY